MTEQQSWPIESVGVDEDGFALVKFAVPFHGNVEQLYATSEQLAAAGITPPAPDINFDELPDGTIVHYKHSNAHRIMRDGHWCDLTDGSAVSIAGPEHYTVVHVPAAPDKRTALHTLGLTDEDIAYAAEKWVDGAWLIDGTNKRLTVAIGTAAHEVTS